MSTASCAPCSTSLPWVALEPLSGHRPAIFTSLGWFFPLLVPPLLPQAPSVAASATATAILASLRMCVSTFGSVFWSWIVLGARSVGEGERMPRSTIRQSLLGRRCPRFRNICWPERTAGPTRPNGDRPSGGLSNDRSGAVVPELTRADRRPAVTTVEFRRLDRPAHRAPGSGRAAFAGLVGTTPEWCDFFLYGSAAVLVFPRLFFPAFQPFTAALLAFATYSVGFVARPLGGILFGHFGDRVGRRDMLVYTLLLMGAATVGMALLPTHEQVGTLAPALLVTLRLLQGLGLGGEWAGAVVMAFESALPGRRGLAASWPQVGVPAGNLLATAMLWWM